ncbi:MAG: hypothetical protein J0I11_00755 [Actinobacteria bacterium]|nr:hypothetical protein [Actinomycetota bacterium]
MTTPTPAPRTAYQWAPHCDRKGCTRLTLTFYGRSVGMFAGIEAVLAYVNQHPRGPR